MTGRTRIGGTTEPGAVFVLALDAGSIGWVTTALAEFRKGMVAGCGMKPPPGFDQLLELCVTTVRDRQSPPRVDAVANLPDAAGMGPLLLNYAAAATRLGISRRSLERLVATGSLPTVAVPNAGPRIRVTDLEKFAASLQTTDRERTASWPPRPKTH